MRYSQLFGKTFREIPHDIRSRSQVLLVQAGYVCLVAQGLYSYLPLGYRTLGKLTDLMRDEMNRLEGQEVRVPLVNPMEFWRKGGRVELIDRGMIRFRDRTGRELVLSPSHEEAMVELVRGGLRSYRDLPIFLYQFQTKFRDEDKTRPGLLRAKEFIMKDAYSFHRTASELNNFFPKVFASYNRIFQRLGLNAISAESDVGFMAGEKAYEFLMPSEDGDDTVIVCDNCGYRANREVAKSIKKMRPEEPGILQAIDTPDCRTMHQLAQKLDLAREKLAKAIVYRTSDGFVMAVIRADYEINEVKLASLIQKPIRGMATDRALRENNFVPGYLSPIGREDIEVIVDESVAQTPNLVFGANRDGKHFKNGNLGRDFGATMVGDIVLVSAGERCLQCHSKLREVQAIELGNIFKLGDFYTKAMDLHFQDDHGETLFPQMGSYGIGMGRLLSAIVAAHSDEKGIVWPREIAPYAAFLMGIGSSLSVKRYMEQLHTELWNETLLDDRHESPGVKFKDADLIGIPLRVVVTSKLLNEGKAELHDRRSGKTWHEDAEKISEVVRTYGT